MNRYQAVFFDFDYTLGDATDCIVEGFRYAFERMGLPAPEREAVRTTIGMTLENAYTLLTGDTDPQRQAQFHALYVEKANPLQVQGTRLFPGCRALLDWLSGEGIVTAIVSTKRRQVIEEILAHQGLSHQVAFVVGGGDVKHYKPHPDSALLALEQAGVPRQRVLFVGDTVIDAETARRAGLDFAAVCNGTTPADAFSPYPCRYTARNLTDFLNWIKEQEL
jgi:phosphoglycolate phosphatase